MRAYHGSYRAVEKPDISFSRTNTDFGKGFYTTTIKSQSEKWAERFKKQRGAAVVSEYEFNEPELRKNISVLEWTSYCEDWLDFIAECRRGGTGGSYDLVIGGIANDDVFNTLMLYFRGFIDKKESIKRLAYEKPNIQYCFRNQFVIDTYLVFLGSTAL
jgi:hypothetical protein